MLDAIFISEAPANAMQGTYSPTLVLISFAVAAFASYTGLALAGEVSRARTAKIRALLFLVGPFALGAGVWSMHFIGMLAFQMDMPMTYDPTLTVLSMLIAVLIAFGVFRVAMSSRLGLRNCAGGAVLLGTAICGMHYTGMAAMKMDLVSLRYIPSLFFLSVAIAVAASGAALWIFFHLSRYKDGLTKTVSRIAAALVMGAAICGMHYTGMFAAVFIPSPDMCVTPMPAGGGSDNIMALWIAVIMSIILGIAISLVIINKNDSLFPASGEQVVFPVRLLGLSMCLTLLSLFWMGGNSYFVHGSIDSLTTHFMTLNDLSTQITYLDDARTVAAERAIGQKDAVWKKKYDDYIVSLQKDFQDIRSQYTDPDSHDELAAIETANKKLLALENNAFSLMQQKKYAAAAALLTGPAYKKHKHDYAENSHLFAKETDAYTRNALSVFSRDLYYAIFLFILTVPVQAVIWLFTLLSLRRWRSELVVARFAAENANRTKGEFLANMSHDLRTPMNGILGLSQLLAAGKTYPEQDEMIRAILKSGESLLFLLNDILDFSKMEAGELALEESPFNLKESMENVVNLLSPLASKKGVILRCDYCDDSSPFVVGDSTRISQIVTNLVGNAIKFTEKGHVHLTVRSEIPVEATHALYYFSIEDTGIGILPEVQGKLFRKFEQGDASTNRRFGGSGLGLAITKMLVMKMRGEISFESTPGQGTTFTVKIPLKPAQAKQIISRNTTCAQTLQQGASFAGFSVLAVDDHPVNRLFATKLLKKFGFQRIDEATNGIEALQKIESCAHCYDLILMDCQMPEMDGFEAVRRIREIEEKSGAKRIPIIAMTAHAMVGDRVECLRAGMDDYISKPVSPEKLHAALCHWLLDAAAPVQKAPPAESAPVQPEKAPVALDHLMLFTEGDSEQEKMMADIFISSGRETLHALMRHLNGQETNDDWRKASHKLKGSALQIGAFSLAEACLLAESASQTEKNKKETLLHDIEHQFSQVQAFFAARRETDAVMGG